MDILTKLRNSENFTCCMSVEERIQFERSQGIDRQLDDYKRRYVATQKIVLLGAGESGKSTFLKQMQIIHGKGFKLEDKLFFRTQIYENILKGMAGLINGKKELRLPWRGNGLYNDSSNEMSNDMIGSMSENANHIPIDVTIRMKSILNQFTFMYKKLIEERERESLRLNKRISIVPDDFTANNLIELIIKIWNDEAIREAYYRRRELPKYFVENVPYFIDNIDRIGRKVMNKIFAV